VIANERQYRITKAAAQDFEEALARLEAAEGSRTPEIRRLMREGLESQLEELREQLAEYEGIRGGKIAVLEVDGLRELPNALIRARIAAGLTQRDLARRLGLKEQQIQRYEATRYAGVSLQRVDAVAEALGVKIREEVILPTAARD
jgi:DNA-binding XRE family transcriptional regulator